MDLDALKLASEARLRDLGAGINPGLPPIEQAPEVQPRTARDVAGRACALGYITGLGFGADRETLADYLSRYRLNEWVTSRERGILGANAISEQDRIDCTWLPEAIQALGWALGLVALDPNNHCDDTLASKFPIRSDPADFIAAAELRPPEELQAEVDFHYRLHWWVRDCELNDTESGFVTSIVMERRRALDWVYGVCADWDEISLDT